MTTCIVRTNYDWTCWVIYKDNAWYLGWYKVSLQYILREVEEKYHSQILALAHEQQEMEEVRQEICQEEVWLDSF